MFERFTEPAEADDRARPGRGARAWATPYVGTEHLLLGLVADDGGPGGRGRSTRSA